MTTKHTAPSERARPRPTKKVPPPRLVEESGIYCTKYAADKMKAYDASRTKLEPDQTGGS